MKTKKELQAYFDEAASWDADRVEQIRRGARAACWVAGAGWVSALAATGALLLLMPLKRVEPFVVRVDNRTGIVDVVPAYEGGAPLDEAVTRYFLTHYVQVCERFNFATAQGDYEECGAFHAAKRNQDWYAQWNPSNPASPLNLYQAADTVRAEVQSVSFLPGGAGVGNGAANLAQVRYVKAERQDGGSQPQFTHWIATLRYAYTKPAQDPKARRWNPLGFKVLDFQSEPEVLEQTP